MHADGGPLLLLHGVKAGVAIAFSGLDFPVCHNRRQGEGKPAPAPVNSPTSRSRTSSTSSIRSETLRPFALTVLARSEATKQSRSRSTFLDCCPLRIWLAVARKAHYCSLYCHPLAENWGFLSLRPGPHGGTMPIWCQARMRGQKLKGNRGTHNVGAHPLIRGYARAKSVPRRVSGKGALERCFIGKAWRGGCWKGAGPRAIGHFTLLPPRWRLSQSPSRERI
jgi:hypothetical protein